MCEEIVLEEAGSFVVLCFLDTENEGSMLLRNVGEFLSDYTASHCRR
jgi:hypothetical protein